MCSPTSTTRSKLSKARPADPYEKATLAWNHDPKRERKLLAHRREIRKLEEATKPKGVTLIPLAIYFKDGRAKVELGVAKGKQQYDKRASIKKKEMDRDVRRAMTQRQQGRGEREVVRCRRSGG